MEPLIFVTGNAGKLREAEAALHRPVRGWEMHLEELQTTDMAHLVRHKALQAHAQVGRPLFVEDTALTFRAWGDLPGPYCKDFLGNLGLEGLVRALAPFADDRAVALTVIGYHDGQSVHIFRGEVAGRIEGPRGSGGFGWDPIFVPAGAALTFGEMDLAQKAPYSMRVRALAALAAHLDQPAAT